MSDKRYLLRTPQRPFKLYKYHELHDHIGTNVGNLVYVAGTVKALMTSEGTGFQTYVKRDYPDAEVDEINENFDGFIITLADALRDAYVDSLQVMTRLIKRLKIPCVVIGVGLKADYEPGADLRFSFDDTAREFFSAILDHSARIGVRGQVTGDYLKALGFREEQDYTVIGCPSMYMWGDSLPFTDKVSEVLASADAPLSFNVSPTMTDRTYELISTMAADYKNAVYIPQNKTDEILMYYGVPIDASKRPASYPVDLKHPFYRDHEAKFFNNPVSWIEFQKTRSMSFGTRLHGNITAVLAGTPALFLPQEIRQRELCEYHGFANLSPAELENISDLREAIPKLDFSRPQKVHRRNFENYRDFLRINGIDNIFEHPEITEAPYDKRAEKFKDIPALHQVSRDPVWIRIKRKREWKNGGQPLPTPAPVKAFRRVKKKLSK